MSAAATARRQPPTQMARGVDPYADDGFLHFKNSARYHLYRCTPDSKIMVGCAEEILQRSLEARADGAVITRYQFRRAVGKLSSSAVDVDRAIEFALAKLAKSGVIARMRVPEAMAKGLLERHANVDRRAWFFIPLYREWKDLPTCNAKVQAPRGGAKKPPQSAGVEAAGERAALRVESGETAPKYPKCNSGTFADVAENRTFADAANELKKSLDDTCVRVFGKPFATHVAERAIVRLVAPPHPELVDSLAAAVNKRLKHPRPDDTMGIALVLADELGQSLRLQRVRAKQAETDAGEGAAAAAAAAAVPPPEDLASVWAGVKAYLRGVLTVQAWDNWFADTVQIGPPTTASPIRSFKERGGVRGGLEIGVWVRDEVTRDFIVQEYSSIVGEALALASQGAPGGIRVRYLVGALQGG